VVEVPFPCPSVMSFRLPSGPVSRCEGNQGVLRVVVPLHCLDGVRICRLWFVILFVVVCGWHEDTPAPSLLVLRLPCVDGHEDTLNPFFPRCSQRTLVGSVYNSKSYSTMGVPSAHRDAFLSVPTPGLSTSDSGGP
jgi:hypothetical protein